jgi:flavorubredoxin
MVPIQLKKDLWWLGVVDWDLRDFHGYETEKGTTYNSYLLRGVKTALFDTVKSNFTGRLIDNVKRVIEPEKINYLVVNHAEMDHTGALPTVIDLVKPDKIICTKACKDALIAHFHQENWPFEIIQEGGVLDLGGKTIRFFGSAMIHWPDSMVSFIEEDKVLISNDIFGQHWATSERYDDQVDQGELDRQSAKYYANIFMPTSPAVRKFLGKLDGAGLSFELLAPDHGLMWRRDVQKIIKAYRAWSAGETKAKAIVVYDTMWESTARMARAVAEGLADENISTKLFDLRRNHRSEVMTEALDARAIILGSSIINGGILPKMADMISYMKGLRPLNKIGASFGSYGWSNVIVKMLNEALEEMKINIVHPGVSSHYVPDNAALDACMELGTAVKKAIKGNQA